MEDSKTLFFSLKFSWEREKMSMKLIDSFGKRPQKGPPALP
jgi:hypothetical protein